jgi:hypothetical protein
MSATSDGNVSSIQTLAQLANQWEIKHLQYEGGPDNGGGSTQNIGNRIAANRIPEMKTAVIHNYTDNWFSANANGSAPLGTNDLVNYFVLSGGVSRYGCWGAIEDLKFLQDLSKAPKYDALCSLTGMCGNEPDIALLTPANNGIVPINTSVNVTANASDPDGTVRKVEFFAGPDLIGMDSVSPYSISWIPTKLGVEGILAKAIDNDGKFTFTDAHVITVVPNTSGTTENVDKIGIQIFPVPAYDVLEIRLLNTEHPGGQIVIRDALGNVRLNQAFHGSLEHLDISHLNAGIYFATLEVGHQQYIRKIIKAN